MILLMTLSNRECCQNVTHRRPHMVSTEEFADLFRVRPTLCCSKLRIESMKQVMRQAQRAYPTAEGVRIPEIKCDVTVPKPEK